jgi:hypothetical protein
MRAAPIMRIAFTLDQFSRFKIHGQSYCSRYRNAARMSKARHRERLADSIRGIEFEEHDPAGMAPGEISEISGNNLSLCEKLTANAKPRAFDIERRIILMSRIDRHAPKPSPLCPLARESCGAEPVVQRLEKTTGEKRAPRLPAGGHTLTSRVPMGSMRLFA